MPKLRWAYPSASAARTSISTGRHRLSTERESTNMSKLMSPFAALCTVGFIARLSYALARSPVLPLFALYLGAGPEGIGFAVGISTVTGIFFKLPAGALSDIISRKRTMLIGLVVFAVMPFMYLLVRDYRLLIVVRFVHGLATAIYGPVSMAVVADIAGTKKGEMLSWFSSITIIGNLLGAPLGGFILHNMADAPNPALPDFQMAYLASGVAGILSLLLAVEILHNGKTGVDGKNLRDAYKRFISGINEFQAGLLWGIQIAVTIVSKPVMGRTSDRFGRKPLIVIGMFLCAGAFGAIPLLGDFWSLMVAAVFFGVGESFVTSSSAALVADICQEKHFGTAMGTFGTIFDIGHASGPILAGFLIARYDYLYSFWIMSSILVVAIPVFMATVKIEKNMI